MFASKGTWPAERPDLGTLKANFDKFVAAPAKAVASGRVGAEVSDHTYEGEVDLSTVMAGCGR